MYQLYAEVVPVEGIARTITLDLVPADQVVPALVAADRADLGWAEVVKVWAIPT